MTFFVTSLVKKSSVSLDNISIPWIERNYEVLQEKETTPEIYYFLNLDRSLFPETSVLSS